MSVESKQIVGLYAHKLPNGIKIGYTKDYKARLSQYNSSGNKTHLIRQCPATRQIDEELKKILIPMFPENKTGRETYNITEKQLHEIFDTIEEDKCVTEEKIHEIVFPDEDEPGSNTTIVYMDDFKSKEGIKENNKEGAKQPTKNKRIKKAVKSVVKGTIKPIILSNLNNKSNNVQPKKATQPTKTTTMQLTMTPTIITPTIVSNNAEKKSNNTNKLITNQTVTNKTIDANKFPIYNSVLSVWPDNHGNNARFTISAELFQNIWGRRINKYEKNRVIDNSRVTRLSQYIADNYDKPSYILPELICTQKENSYILLDGQHRAAAIFKLVESDDSYLDLCVPINISGIDLTDTEIYEKFISINKSVPIADCCLSSVEIDKLQKEVLKKLQNTFGKDIYMAETAEKKTQKASRKIEQTVITNMIDNKKLNILSKTLPMFIPTTPQICKVLIDLNDSLVDRCQKIGLIGGDKVINDEKGVDEFTDNINKHRQTTSKIGAFQNAISSACKYANKTRKPVFLLGLLSIKSDIVSMIIEYEMSANESEDRQEDSSDEECKSEGLSDIDDGENDMNIDD